MTQDTLSVSVLIVDDNPAKLLALEAALAGMEIEIVTVTSGTDALRKLLAQDFAVVLLDGNMPVMNGFETAEMIRRRPQSAHLPIIFVTAEALTDDAQLKGYELGAVDYIIRPVLPRILRSKVATFVDLYRLHARDQRYAEELRGKNAEIERRVVERTAELERSEQRLSLLVTRLADGVMVLDRAGVILFLNPAADQLFGQSREALLNTEFGFPMVVTGEATEIDIRQPGGAIVEAEIRLVETEWLGQSAWVVALHDVSERKQAETAIRRVNAELERSNQELDDFAYIASHDLKEPLRGIHNYASFLIEDYAERLSQDGQNKLRTIARLATRMEQLINDLLYFSRMGRWELDLGPVDMNVALDAAREALEARLAETGGRIECPRPLPSAWSDRTRIPGVFQNLISNALKYNDRADKWVEVGWQDLPEPSAPPVPPGQRVYYVRDNGIGIRANQLGKVFLIFKRLHGRDQYGGGSGAGLTITRKLLHHLGGEIWVTSVYGEGSTFYFRLPAIEPP